MKKYISHNRDFYDSTASSFSDISKIPAYVFDYQKPERDKFATYVKKGKVLDAGCGSGLQCHFLSQYSGLEITGIDISGGQLENARRLCPNADFQNMDIRYPHFPEHYFDGVWANASLIHVSPEDMSGTLTKFHCILKQNGVFYASFKSKQSLRNTGHASSITFFYQPDEIKKYFLDSGFNILESYTYDEDRRTESRGREVLWTVIFARK